MSFECEGRVIETDEEGYLLDSQDWSRSVALMLAQDKNINLDEAHWEVLALLRNFYLKHQLSPPMRPLVRLLRQELGSEKGRSIYLLKLFPGSPAKLAALIAGLPRPENCL